MMMTAFKGDGVFRRGNLHCHSVASDGWLTPERVCAYYREAGYDFVCLTDHFLEEYDFPISDTRGFRGDGLTTLIGAELHAPDILAGEIWHILAVGLPLDFARPSPAETGPALAARALAAGAFVALPHPEWYGLTLEDALSMPEVHAVEAFNAICDVHSGRSGGDYLIDQMLTAGRRPGVLATDDAHDYQADAGRGWVMVKAADDRPETLLAALKNGAYYASSGPEIRHVDTVGDHLHIETSPIAHAFLVGRGSRSEAMSGEAITRARLPLSPLEGGWARLIVVDAAGRRAWTNPLFG